MAAGVNGASRFVMVSRSTQSLTKTKSTKAAKTRHRAISSEPLLTGRAVAPAAQPRPHARRRLAPRLGALARATLPQDRVAQVGGQSSDAHALPDEDRARPVWDPHPELLLEFQDELDHVGAFAAEQVAPLLRQPVAGVDRLRDYVRSPGNL